MLYSKRWPYALVLLLAIGVLARDAGLLIAVALASVALGSAWLWNRYALAGVQYERTLDVTRAFPGEYVELTVRVTNRKLLPLLWLDIADEFPAQLPLARGNLHVTPVPTVGLLRHVVALRWYERVSWQHQLEAKSRGYYAFGPLTLRSGDLFGLFQSEERRAEQSFLLVYPRVVPLAQLGLPAKQPFGDIRATQRLFEDPGRTVGVRDYVAGDSLKRVHWKATAHRQALQARQYEHTATPLAAIFLNVATFEHYWGGIDAETLEGLITVVASLAAHALQEGYATGLFANAPPHHGDQAMRVPPSSSPQQLPLILEALAKLNPFALASIEETLQAEVRRLPWAATLVVATAVVSPALASVLSRLRQAGRPTVLVTFGERTAGDDAGAAIIHTIRGEDLLQPAAPNAP